MKEGGANRPRSWTDSEHASDIQETGLRVGIAVSISVSVVVIVAVVGITVVIVISVVVIVAVAGIAVVIVISVAVIGIAVAIGISVSDFAVSIPYETVSVIETRSPVVAATGNKKHGQGGNHHQEPYPVSKFHSNHLIELI